MGRSGSYFLKWHFPAHSEQLASRARKCRNHTTTVAPIILNYHIALEDEHQSIKNSLTFMKTINTRTKLLLKCAIVFHVFSCKKLNQKKFVLQKVFIFHVSSGVSGHVMNKAFCQHLSGARTQVTAIHLICIAKLVYDFYFLKLSQLIAFSLYS